MNYKHERKYQRVGPPIDAKMPLASLTTCDLQAVDKYIAGRGINPKIAQYNGWYPSRSAGDRELRVVIPATNTVNYPYWQARAIDASVHKRYMSPSYSSGNSIVIVWPVTGVRFRRAVVVEGPFDALAAAECGVPGLSLMGKQPTSDVYDHIILAFPRYELTVIPDSDALQSAGTIVGELARRGAYVLFKVPGGKDLASLSYEARSLLLRG